MRILIKTSRWAIWARRLAGLALPLVVIPILLHRQAIITSTVFEILETVALIVAGLALLFSLVAILRLWYSGDRGWGQAVTGLILALICLAPFSYLAVEDRRHPAVTDVTTSVTDAPVLSMIPEQVVTAEEQAAITADFPNVRTRTYPIAVADAAKLANNLAAARGWRVTLRMVPQNSNYTGGFEATASTLLGWREQVAVRLRGRGEEGVTVDMRSASIDADRDFGSNGQRIEEYLLALDNAVTLFLRDLPVGTDATAEPAPEDPAEPVEEEPAAPAEPFVEPVPEG